MTQPCYSISGSVRSRSSAGDVSSDSGDGTADCAHLGFAPLDVDLRMLPKELVEKVVKLLFQVVGTELFRIFRIFWIFRARKVQKLPARLISSELRAHQMSPSGVPPHWRSRRAPASVAWRTRIRGSGMNARGLLNDFLLVSCSVVRRRDMSLCTM